MDAYLEHHRKQEIERYRRGHAIQAALLANIHRNPEQQRDAFSEEDFLPLTKAEVEARNKTRAVVIRERARAAFQGMFNRFNERLAKKAKAKGK